VTFDLQAWLEASAKVVADSMEVPEAERNDANAEPFKRRAMELAIEFADGIGTYEQAWAAYQSLRQLGDAIMYRWPDESVEDAVRNLAEMRRTNKMDMMDVFVWGETDEHDRTNAERGVADAVAKVKSLLGGE
jgi:hypothetical protein